ncbi:SusC/RagA family TonB-linked outer membrane protein [Aquirufa sp. 2-AUSEE-184A6]|uniref:SusC/RagA family TonB-linked outer membrane protein n=1 Tax=Aquirufa novilacunae TaxID=3139305 RepID=A0ABW8SXY9_9BACT
MKKNLLMTFLLTMLSVATIFAQDKKVTGKVTSAEDGSGLPGVTVQIKGTGKGTQSDMNGNYSLSVPSSATLVYSFVGLNSKSIAVGNQTVIDVKLSTDSRQLSEVVVTGTGTAIDKRSTAIDVQAITAKNLPSVPSASVDQALIGKIAGAQISSANGMPGQPVNIVLRGINTINRGTSPMILLDGVELGATDLNSIDLNIIEKVEVIQGAAAATIYGAQGANGVIQLFSKKGKAGKVTIDINSSVINSTPLNVGNLSKANKHGFKTNANNEVIGGSGNPLALDPVYGAYGENVILASTDPTTNINKAYDRNLKYYDHFAMFFVPTTNYNNSVAISGGSDKSDFSLSLSNSDNAGPFKNVGGLNRTNLTANLGFELAKGLKLRSITQLVHTKNTINDGTGRSIIFSVFNSRPFVDYDFKDADGNFPGYFGDAVGVNGYNPNAVNYYTTTDGKRIDISQSMNLNYEINKFVSLDAKYGLNYQTDRTKYTYLNQTGNKNIMDQQYWYYNYNGNDATGEINNYESTSSFQNLIGSAFIKTDFIQDFGINIPLRTSTQLSFDYRNRENTSYVSYGIGLPNYTPYNTSQAASTYVARDYREPFITYGYLVNQRFDYGTLGGFSGGFRTDYSSAFGAASTPQTFPRGDAYFRISELGIFKNSAISTTLEDFKIRAAYGEAGIQPRPFDRYITLNTGVIGAGNAFYFPLTQSNPNLNVEISKELEIGTDIGLNLGKNSAWLNNVNFSGTYWKRSTDNAIFNVDGIPSSGIGTVKDNAFSLASNGIQASLNAQVYKDADWTWNFTMNFGKQSSEITAVRGGAEVVLTSAAGSTGYILKAGEKIGQLYGYYGIHSLDAKLPDGTVAIPEADRGLYTVASNGWVVNKTTKAPFFSPKRYALGDPNPDFTASFITDLAYKGIITLNLQVDLVQGAGIYNQTKGWMYRDGIHSDYAQPITIDGQTGAWSAFYRGVYAARSFNGTKNYFYEDGSFARLRNISVGVDLVRAFGIKGFRKLQLVASGRNLYTLTNYSGMDPEIASGGNNSAWDRGIDHNTMPNLRSYQVQLNIGF